MVLIRETEKKTEKTAKFRKMIFEVAKLHEAEVKTSTTEGLYVT